MGRRTEAEGVLASHAGPPPGAREGEGPGDRPAGGDRDELSERFLSFLREASLTQLTSFRLLLVGRQGVLLLELLAEGLHARQGPLVKALATDKQKAIEVS